MGTTGRGPAPAAATIPAGPPTARGQATRAALLAAGREVFERDGYDDARINDITAAAGVASGSFYTYFRSKLELFHEVATEVLDDLVASARRPRGAPLDPVRDIGHATRAYLTACARNAKVIGSIQQLSLTDPALRDLRRDRRAAGARKGEAYIRRLQAAGLADADVDARTTAAALQSMVIAVAYDEIILFDAGADLDRLVDTLTTIWVRAITPRAG